MGKENKYYNKSQSKAILAKQPLETIAIDFISNLVIIEQGNKHIYVIVDVISKFIKTLSKQIPKLKM